ncbi:glutamate 5-kinase [Thermoproteota archaeon]
MKKITLKKSDKVIVKIGTNILTTPEGKLDLNNLRALVAQICDSILAKQCQFIIVTSGSIICGSERLSITAKTIPEKQAAASVGQILLMQEYARFFENQGLEVGQILLTKDCITDSTKRANVKNTITTLLKQTVTPIINENDSVATDEMDMRFGDNDELSCTVAKLTNAKLLILLTDTDGLHTCNPKTHKQDAKLIPSLTHISDDIMQCVEDVESHRSQGGMASKLRAAKEASQAGIDVVIANGRRANVIKDILLDKAVGTKISA